MLIPTEVVEYTGGIGLFECQEELVQVVFVHVFEFAVVGDFFHAFVHWGDEAAQKFIYAFVHFILNLQYIANTRIRLLVLLLNLNNLNNPRPNNPMHRQ